MFYILFELILVLNYYNLRHIKIINCFFEVTNIVDVDAAKVKYILNYTYLIIKVDYIISTVLSSFIKKRVGR